VSFLFHKEHFAMSIVKMMLGGAAAAVLIIAVGCNVESRYPLSDEKTSTPDLKLIGDWREKGDADKEGWRIAKHPKSENVLMAFMLPAELDTPDLLFTTAIDGKKYLSWGGRDLENNTTVFFVCRYEMPDENTLEVRFLPKDAIRKAITENRLAGKIKIETHKKPGVVAPMEQRETIRITAETKDLRAFVEANADSCFPKDGKPDVVYLRVK
jgi:hypothetical protein